MLGIQFNNSQVYLWKRSQCFFDRELKKVHACYCALMCGYENVNYILLKILPGCIELKS